MEEQTRASERKSAMSCAASVPSRRNKLSTLDVEVTLPNVAIARGCKRDSSKSRVDSTGAVSAKSISNSSEQRPRKRQKRSSSTPPAPRSSQLSTRLSSLGRTRSRAGSPITDSEHVLPSRASARLARKIFPFMNSFNSDIYTHLADPNGAGVLLSEPPVTLAVLPAQNEIIGSQPTRKLRGRRRKKIDPTDEDAKKDLMEEWARMRQSQGVLSLTGILDGNARFSRMHFGDTSDKGSSVQIDAMSQTNSPDPSLLENRTTSTSVQQSEETTVGVSPENSFSTQTGLVNAFPMGMDTSGEKLDRDSSVLPSDRRIELPTAPVIDIEAPTLFPGSHTDEDSPSDELTAVSETIPRCDSPQSISPVFSDSPSLREDIQVEHATITELFINEQEEDRTYTSDNGIPHEPERGFYMLDAPEVFTLPWLPVASHLYVPPSLGKLISGMREQLAMETRARQRAEELYQVELNRRISAEKCIEGLQAELEEKHLIN